jgi:type I restriction enzyme S subunit
MHLGGLDMGLIRIKLGKYIELFSEKCNIPNLSNDDVSGVNKDKEFFEPSNQVGSDTSKYKIVPPGYFACNLMHVGRDVVLPIAYNHSNNNKIVSPAYQVFKFLDNEELLSEYFFLYLKSSEIDRFFWFNTDGSVRDGMSWHDFIGVEMELPPLPIQQKYVDVYNAMLKNQKNYERGLEDLKLVCDAYIENLSNCKQEKIGKYVERNKKKNQDVIFSKCDVKGFNNEGQFIEPMRLFSGDISTFKIISKDDLVYNSRINSTIKKLSIVINEGKDLIVSPAYESFKVVKEKELCPFYLYMLLQRESFARKVLFNSFGSSTIVFGFDDLCEIEIPVPSFSEQESIANMYRLYKERWNINEKLKAQIKDICPILIKGSIEEARKAKEA